MKNYILPTSFTNGTVLLIGDQFTELATIRKNLLPDFFYRLFDEPDQAQNFLLKHYSSHIYQQPWITRQHNQQIDFSFNKLSYEFNTSHRFEEISVVVIDSSMQKYNAREFCHQIKLTDYKKILLISSAQLPQAKMDIQSGLIDGYVVKDNRAALYLKLTTAISIMAFHYFQQAALPVVTQLKDLLPQLNDIAFIDFFQTLCFDKNIVEFYLLDNQGSYLLLDKNAKPFYLQVGRDSHISQQTKASITQTIMAITYYCCLFDRIENMPITLNNQALFLLFVTEQQSICNKY